MMAEKRKERVSIVFCVERELMGGIRPTVFGNLVDDGLDGSLGVAKEK